MSKTESTPTYRSGTASVQASSGASSPEQGAAALEFLRELAIEVSQGTVDLPCFSNVVVRISEALMDPTTTSEQVVIIAGAEPRLAARLLQTANSAAFNTAGKPVADLRSAITRIGQQTVQSIAISYAIKQMQYEAALQSVEQPLADLWKKSVAVACTCQVVAERTKVRGDVAFLTGLLHGIGSLYIMAQIATRSVDREAQRLRLQMVDGWQASVGKAVLESWGFDEIVCEAIADQRDYDRKWQHDPGLTDVLIASLVIADEIDAPEPRAIVTDGVNAFTSIGLDATECRVALTQAEQRIALVNDALK